MAPSPSLSQSSVQVVFDSSSELQSDAAAVLAASVPQVAIGGPLAGHDQRLAGLICLDADLFDELPPGDRAAAWYAPLAWHRDAVVLPSTVPGHVLLLRQALAELFPRSQCRQWAYPLGPVSQRRVDRESARQRLGISPGRLAVFCREESSPLMRVMKALENDERVTVLTPEESAGPQTAEERAREAVVMTACDLILAESSARAVAESLAHGVPLAALVRDEGDANARFLAEAGAGIVAERPGEMLMLVDALAGDYPAEIARMRRAMEPFRMSTEVRVPSPV